MACLAPADRKRTLEAASAELDKVTDILCSVLEGLEKEGSIKSYLSPEKLAWWEEHKAWDEDRMSQAA